MESFGWCWCKSNRTMGNLTYGQIFNVGKFVKYTQNQMVSYVPTATPADTGKAADVYFERQWPGAADQHVITYDPIHRSRKQCNITLPFLLGFKLGLGVSSVVWD